MRAPGQRAHSLKLLSCEAGTCVADRHLCPLSRCAGINGHGACRGRRGERVADDVGEDLGDPVGVGPHGQRAWRVDGQGNVAVAELRRQPSGRPPGQVSEVGISGMQVQPLLLGPGQRRQVVGEPAQPP